MPSAAIIILLALAFLAVTEALPVLASTLIIARSSDVTIFPFNESSNATSDLSSTSWVDSWQTSAATYFLFIYCSLSLVALVLMVTNRSGTQDLVFRLFDWMSDCFTWPLAPERRTVSLLHCSHPLFTSAN